MIAWASTGGGAKRPFSPGIWDEELMSLQFTHAPPLAAAVGC